MIRSEIKKLNINNSNHLKDIYAFTSNYLEIGTIDYKTMVRLLNYELINYEDITYLPIQNRGLGKSNVKDEDLQNILPFLFYENVHKKNHPLQLFLTYGLIKLKNEHNQEMFSPLVLIPIHIYLENNRCYIQQVSQPIENQVLLKYLNDVKKINIPSNEKLDNAYAIDRYCFSFEKIEGIKLDLECFLTYAPIIQQEIKLDHSKFDILKNYDNYLYEHLFYPNEKPIYYLDKLNRFQRYAVHSAYEGDNLVITGRLGTGKTTTLMNIAINAISQNKRVLYVSNMKETLDDIYSFFEKKNMQQYVTNFSNSFASFHQGELIINHNYEEGKEIDFEPLFVNYKFINDFEKAMTGRILDNRFIDVINELVLVSEKEKQLLEIDNIASIYKFEYFDILKALKNIQDAMVQIGDFQNSIWKDIPIINNIKYPNQVYNLIYQVQKGFIILKQEKEILEKEFGFKEISNYAYFKNIIHNFQSTNIKNIPSNWLDRPTYEKAKEEYRNLKNDIYILQELEYLISCKYVNLHEFDAKKEIDILFGSYFQKSDSDKINQIIHDRQNLIVKNRKCLLQTEIFNKAIHKIRNLMNWDFSLDNEVLIELVKLYDIIVDLNFNNKMIKIISDDQFENIYEKAKGHYHLIIKYQDEKESLFKGARDLKLGDLDSTVESFEQFNNNQPLKRSVYRLINNLKEKEPTVFSNQLTRVKKFRELTNLINHENEAFYELVGFYASEEVLNDFYDLNKYLSGLQDKLIKSKIIKFLKKANDTPDRQSKNHLKNFDLFVNSYQEILHLYEQLIVYQFNTPSSNFSCKLQFIKEFNGYLENLFASVDRYLAIIKKAEKEHVEVEDYFELHNSLEKLKELKANIKNNQKYQSLYQDLFADEKTDLNKVSRLLQSYKLYMECFKDQESVLSSIIQENYDEISKRLELCNHTSENLNEVFKIYFKIFKNSVSRYYYANFYDNLIYLDSLLKQKDELIIYLRITDNFKVLTKYRLEKFIDYIVELKDYNHLVTNFKYTYFTAVKNMYLQEYPYLSNYKAFESCLGVSIELEDEIINEMEKRTFNNIQKNSGNRFSIFGVKNLDYNGYVRRTNNIKHLFLTNTEVLNSFLNIKYYDLVIVDDAHLFNTNEYHLAIQGKQVVVAGELQLQKRVANNLISRLGSSRNINLNYRYSIMPRSLQNHISGLIGKIYENYYDNYGVEVISENILEYISLLFKQNNKCVVNLFVVSIERQRIIYEKLASLLLDEGFTTREIISIFTKQLNISDLEIGYLYNADYNIVFLDEYYDVNAEHIVVNEIDNLLLCKKKLIIYDNNNYLQEDVNSNFLIELRNIVNNQAVFHSPRLSDLLKMLVDKLEKHKVTCYESNVVTLLVRKKSKLLGVMIYWDDNKTNYDILNEYRDLELNIKRDAKKNIVVWSMELIESMDSVVERILGEIDDD